MDDGFQQKKNRLDSLSSRLARGNAQARANSREEARKCKGCAAELAAGVVGDVCSNCNTPGGSGTSIRRAGMCCAICGVQVQPVSSFLTCSVCKKWIHTECERSLDASDTDEYSCAKCRHSPLEGEDAMLGVGGESPLADPEASNQDASQLGSIRSSPFQGSVGGESGRYSQRERRMSGSSESSSYSARNSPSFDPNALSEDDEEFRPGRGGGASRGGRGGKKKPGGRGGTLMKTRSGGKPPSGVFSDRLGKTDRGKRGKGRGAGKAGSTSAGKGGGAAARGGGGARRTSTTPRAALGMAALKPFLALQNATAAGNALAVLQQAAAVQLQQQAAAAAAAVAAAGGVAAPAAAPPAIAAAAAAEGRNGTKDDEYVRTIVIAPEDDIFLFSSPLCLVCGSIGRGSEQSMVACSGCAHTFHTYCVGLHDKMNETVVKLGWRCLDCTICEGCGQNKDDSKLIMCEECDVAYHMYCLNPPVERAPTGPWRCQWCARCRRCTKRVANSGELTKEGLCYPCLSLRKCPKCNKLYNLNDNIIRCSQCNKWYHGVCEDLHSEEMLESAALNKMRCSNCRPNAQKNSCYSSANDGNLILCDNVALNKCADEVLQSKMMPSFFRANSFTSSSENPLSSLLSDFRSGGSMDSHYGGSMDDDNGPDDDGGLSSLISFGPGSRGGRGGGRGGGAGRGGRQLKLGIGGFFVKMPKHKMLAAEEEENALVDPNDPTKKVKRQRKPRRSQLEDAYPSNIQEGFFGTRPVDGKMLMDVEVTEPILEDYKEPKTIKDPFASGDKLSMEASEALRNDLQENSMLDNMNLNDFMNIDDLDGDLFDNFFDDDDDLEGNYDNNPDLNDALDFMKNDSDSQPKPEVDDSNSQQAPMQPVQHMQQQQQQQVVGFQQQQPGMGPGGMMIKQEPEVMHPQQQHQMMMQHQQHMQHHAGMGPGGIMIKQEPGLMRPDSSMSGGSGVMPAAVGFAHGGVAVQERASASAAATERWEEDEPLGDKATKAAVLYVNIRFPNLRNEHPQWSERAKFIHREWRRLSPDERQIYVRKARDNRAQREKVPRPRIPRILQPGAPGPSGLAGGQPGMGQMRMGAGGGSAPGPGGYGMGGLAGSMRGPMPPPPQQPPSLDHLPPDLQQEYIGMRNTSNDLNKAQEDLEKELSNLRQTKKKLNAKQRQIKKTAETAAMNAATAAAAAAGQPPPTSVPPTDADLNDADKESLARALDGIPNKQRELEEAKRNYKSHMNEMHNFEARNRIQTEYTAAMTAHQQRAGMGGPPGGPTVGGILTASMGRAGMAMSMGGPPGGPGGYQQMVVPQQVPFSQMMGQERGFQLGGIGPGQGMMMGGRMAAMGRWGPPMARSAVLGGVRYEQLQSQEERDVYECMDEMIGKIEYELNGPPPMMQPSQQAMGGFPGGGPSLKRLLDPMAPPPMGMPPMMQADDGAPKQKKKRVMQKKTPLPGGNDYEACKDRLVSSLSSIPPMPRKATEPAPRNEASPFAIIGMGDLGEKYERSSDSRVTLGNLILPFAKDVYQNVKAVEDANEVSMARIMPNARVSLLHQLCQPSFSSSPSTPRVIRDDGDVTAPSTSQCGPLCGDVLRQLVTGVERRKGVIRSTSKAPDWPSSLPEPHRIAFKEVKKEEEDDEVEIAIEIEERCVPGSSGEWGNSTSSTPCREEMTKQLLLKLQQMLDTKKPIEDYQMDTPPLSPTGIDHVDIKPSPHHLHSSSFSYLPHCRLCSREIVAGSCNTGVRQSMSLLGLTPSDDGKDDSVTFCTLKCYYMFVATAKVALSPEQLAKAESHVDEQTYSRLKQISADSFARCINQGAMRVKAELTVGAALAAGFGPASLASTGPPAPTPIGGVPQPDLTSPRDNRFSSLLDEPAPRKENVHNIRCIELAQLADNGKKDRARAAGEDWKKYSQELLNTFLRIHTMKRELSAAPKMGVEPVMYQIDTRRCSLCGLQGDGDPRECGRLLSYDSCAWVHANCALWSSEVYESATGALSNVERAIFRGSQTRCHFCGNWGATLQCFKVECQKSFHIMCARKITGKFVKDKTFICPTHLDVHPDVLSTIEPLRRLYIHRDENKLLAKLFDTPTDGATRLMLRLGAFTFFRLGQLLPEQLKTCHTNRHIFPLGYHAQRMFWSPHDARRRTKYTLTIKEHEGKPMFCVSMLPPRDESALATIYGQPQNTTPFVWQKPTAEEAWKEVLEGVVRCRAQSGVYLRLSLATLEPEGLFGLGESVITKMTESLPGVDTLYSYSFRHGGAPILELPLAENPSGCARCEPRSRTLIKSHRRPVPSGTKSSPTSGAKRTQSLYEELQMCMKASGYRGDFGQMGMNGKWDQYGTTEQSYSAYQKMRKEWRNTVYLARSKIQGLGLYAKRDIDMGSMIIEYKGEVIRAEVCEMREKRYFAQNRGTYMFKASEECIIDATMKGGPARYINHSCDPNCATQIMHLGANGEEKKIIITANRPIKADEELTYDYQFDEEDDSDKVQCLCGAPNCKKVMN